jgi:leader peptidase (prepilin peptidase)/N-methyltransferase
MFTDDRCCLWCGFQMLFGLVLTWVLIALTFIDFDTQLYPIVLLPLAALGLGVNSYSLYVSPTARFGAI